MSLLKYTASSLGFNIFPSFPSSNFLFSLCLPLFLVCPFVLSFPVTPTVSETFRSVASAPKLFSSMVFLFIHHFSLVHKVCHVSRDQWSSLDFIWYDSCFLFSFAFFTDCLSIDHLHVFRHVVLFKHVVNLVGSPLIDISGKLGDVVVLELDGVVAAYEVFIGLTSRSYLPLVWEGNLDPGTDLAGVRRNDNRENRFSVVSGICCVASASFEKF